MLDDQQAINAWAHAEERYQAGQEVHGIVTRVAQFGLFVQVEPGIEGVIYAFELGQGTGALARYTPGQELQIYVKDIDPRRKRLELSPQQQIMPGLLPEREIPPQARHRTTPDSLPWPLQPAIAEKAISVPNASCPTCRREISEHWNYCVYCGANVQGRCPSCGILQPDLPDARYCYACGKAIH